VHAKLASAAVAAEFVGDVVVRVHTRGLPCRRVPHGCTADGATRDDDGKMIDPPAPCVAARPNTSSARLRAVATPHPDDPCSLCVRVVCGVRGGGDDDDTVAVEITRRTWTDVGSVFTYAGATRVPAAAVLGPDGCATVCAQWGWTSAWIVRRLVGGVNASGCAYALAETVDYACVKVEIDVNATREWRRSTVSVTTV